MLAALTPHTALCMTTVAHKWTITLVCNNAKCPQVEYSVKPLSVHHQFVQMSQQIFDVLMKCCAVVHSAQSMKFTFNLLFTCCYHNVDIVWILWNVSTTVGWFAMKFFFTNICFLLWNRRIKLLLFMMNVWPSHPNQAFCVFSLN